jgi:hypothetical protein
VSTDLSAVRDVLTADWAAAPQPQGRPAPTRLDHPAARFLPPGFADCDRGRTIPDHADCPPGCAYGEAFRAWQRARYQQPPASTGGLRGRRRRWALAWWRRTVDRERY